MNAMSQTLEEFDSQVDDLGIYYNPEPVSPKCRRHKIKLVYHNGYWYCPKCQKKVYDSAER